MASEYEHMRSVAIKRYLEGEKITDICADLCMSRKWFYKWRERYESDREDWHKNLSRARHTSSRALNKKMEDMIARVREELEKTKYSQIGAATIGWKLSKLGVDKVPDKWQIDRTLARLGLARHKGPYQSKNKPYPGIEAKAPCYKQDMDFTPSYTIKGHGSTRGLNIIDAYSRKVKVNVCRTKKSSEVINSLITTWKVMGIPNYLQMDNEAAFTVHNERPRSLSRVIRFLLSLGIEPIYIPEYEPWRNGVVEKFNESYKTFFKLDRWSNVEELVEGALRFEEFHNKNHRYSTRWGKTPEEIEEEYGNKPNLLYETFNIREDEKIPLNKKGKLHFIRYIRSDGMLKIFSEKFKVCEDLVYNYVKTTVDIENKCLEIRLNNEIVETKDYKLKE